MNKLFRTKSAQGGLTVKLEDISNIQYTPTDFSGAEPGSFSVEIMTRYGPKDTILTAAELDALHTAWDAAL